MRIGIDGRVIIEAIACGKLVVATDAGGVPENVVNSETGLIVPPKDYEAMAEPIISLLKDRDKAKRMGQAGREPAEKVFAMTTHARKIEKHYEGLFKGEEKRGEIDQ